MTTPLNKVPTSSRPATPVLPLRQQIQSAHLVGIGGAGMKALTELLTGLGWHISGSDLHTSPTLLAMQQRGLRVHAGHQDGHLPQQADVLVYSPAVGPQNPERQLASRLNIPQFSYSQMLGRLMQTRRGVCIAGTHGKSTTTAMTASILSVSGLDPSAIVGAELCERHESGWAGNGDLMVVESCEYQRSFLDLHPHYAVVTNIEPDHFDYFDDLDDARQAFAEFVSLIPVEGRLLVNGENEAARDIARYSLASCETFRVARADETGDFNVDWLAHDVRQTVDGQRFRIFHQGDFFAEIVLQQPGRHSVWNALAAAALSYSAGATIPAIREALADFTGIRRRFERVGSWRGITLVDDYAHHPTAVEATLKAAREKFGDRKIWCAFQPHQVSRTTALLDEFAESLTLADEVLLPPIFAARERLTSEPYLVAQRLAKAVNEKGGHARFLPALDRIVPTIEDEALPGDVLLTMGAGDIDQVQYEFTRRLSRDHTA
ncbi:MAG: UDP-N-acetylmuramate--L-alanine ligase [Planctomycetota bacterium]|nr:UDP-N-acetylmuramate--L-alanine ligase [Planctomycetota bacterium]MDA1214229.1 UDP-N-acetylmuramate--L-alanine ligase [Planctomycetota bacterium]